MALIDKKKIADLLSEHRSKLPYVIGGILLLVVYVFSKSQDSVRHVYHAEGQGDFSNGRILGSDSIYESKERLFAKRVDKILEGQEQLRELTGKLQARIDTLESNPNERENTPTPDGELPKKHQGTESPKGTEAKLPEKPAPITWGQAPEQLIAQGQGEFQRTVQSGSTVPARVSRRPRRGPAVIVFPVKGKKEKSISSVVLPSGSYVKAKLMTGVEAPEGRTYPVLLQLDYAYIVPNQKRLDLSGCFMIAKSQGDLSTERVQMQATKISCVSREGKMFERKVSGFVADDKDNSFAVIGSVNSKQNRVAAMAFLSSIVEGIGKAIQQAQTTQAVNPLGGSSSIVTGNQMAHIGAGGASNAASMVTQWYLKQAQSLLPTINVGSGQDVWVIMQEKVQLPNNYFKKNQGGNGVYAYYSRIVD